MGGSDYNVVLDLMGFFLFLVPELFYFAIFHAQHKQLESATYRLQVLVTRTALFLPVYAFLIVLSLWGPQAYEFFLVPITLMEGYSFYCFFSLLVCNIGGPASVVSIMENSDKGYYCCACACPPTMANFYRRTSWAVWHLLVTRTCLSALAAICHYSGTHAGQVLYSVCSLINAVLLFYGIAHLLILYEYVYEQCKNISGVSKLLLLKVSVGLIVVQGLIEQFLVMDGASPYNDDSQFNVADKTQRGYCALVLIEFVLLSLLSYLAFSPKITAPPSAQHQSGQDTADVSRGAFFCDVLKLHDVCGTISLQDGDMMTPINQA